MIFPSTGFLVYDQARFISPRQIISFPKPSQTADPITIDEKTSNTWIWALNQGICSGEGTKDNPYLIENLKIDAKGGNHPLKIWNSRAHFIIRNCEFFNGNSATYQYGIYLYNTTNGRIERNYCHNNYGGILLEYYSCNNSLISNICSNHNQNTNAPGIYLYSLSSNNTLIQNYCFNNFYGLYLYVSSQSNLIEGNFFYDNEMDGARLHNTCNYNILKGNLFWSNRIYGLSFISCNYNLVYYNALFQNPADQISNSGGNYFNSTSIGNYWGDYSGFDSNHDGIGDAAYFISSGKYDYQPIINYRPVFLQTPSEITINITDSLDLSWLVLDDSTLFRTYSIYQDGIKIVSELPWFTEEVILFSKANLTAGRHVFTIEVSDGYNSPISHSVNVLVIEHETPLPEESVWTKINEFIQTYAILIAGGMIAVSVIISAILRRPKHKLQEEVPKKIGLKEDKPNKK
jgi:parallel beta-helix repeat protein